jgi:carboxyl-terminal processing protease
MPVDEYADGDGLNEFRVREADLQKHLTNDKDLSTDAKQPKVDEMEEEMRAAAQEKKRKPLEYGSKDDFQLMQALNYLKGKPVQTSKDVADAKKTADAASIKSVAPTTK